MSAIPIVIISIIVLIILILIVRNIKKTPFIDRISRKVSLKEQVVDFPPQPVITRDNVTMQIDTVVYFEITDPKLYTYGVEHPLSAIENLTATTLRNIIGDLELDNTLTSRDTINDKIRIILDEATDAWGIKVIRVELKNILPPREIQDAMEKQMKAERERRARILDAEGEKRSQILVAEGLKESAISKPTQSRSKRSVRHRVKRKRSSPFKRQTPTRCACSTKPLPTTGSFSSEVWKRLQRQRTARRPKSLFPPIFRAWRAPSQP